MQKESSARSGAPSCASGRMRSKDTASNTPAPKHRNAEIRRGHFCRDGNTTDWIPQTQVITGSEIVATNLALVTLSILKNWSLY
jgi:hypothetical protein